MALLNPVPGDVQVSAGPIPGGSGRKVALSSMTDDHMEAPRSVTRPRSWPRQKAALFSLHQAA